MNIDGLTYIQDAITVAREAEIMDFIINNDKNAWHDTAGNAVQLDENAPGRIIKQYGVHYNYNERRVMGARRSEMPQILVDLADELKLPRPDNVIINRYLPGEGIAAHVDHRDFGEIIASLSLGCAVSMHFMRAANELHEIYLMPRALLKLERDARWQWKHGIIARKTDLIGNRRLRRGERYSITFRTLR